MNSSPCAKFTTSMMPKISVRPESTSAKIMPATMPLTVWMTMMSQGMPASMPLHSQVLVDDGIVHFELRGDGVVTNGALLHEVDALARCQGERNVLLHQQDRHTLLVQGGDDFADLRDHARHQAFCGLVEKDDLGLQHHRPGNSQHLLLAARERAAGLGSPLSEPREVGERLVQQLLAARVSDARA